MDDVTLCRNGVPFVVVTDTINNNFLPQSIPATGRAGSSSIYSASDNTRDVISGTDAGFRAPLKPESPLVSAALVDLRLSQPHCGSPTQHRTTILKRPLELDGGRAQGALPNSLANKKASSSSSSSQQSLCNMSKRSKGIQPPQFPSISSTSTTSPYQIQDSSLGRKCAGNLPAARHQSEHLLIIFTTGNYACF